jgi:hypothetical protein
MPNGEWIASESALAGSIPVVPTFVLNEPFGNCVEWRSYFKDWSCRFEIVFK